MANILFPNHIVQKFLTDNGTYKATIDGNWGEKSNIAMDTTLERVGLDIRKWDTSRRRTALEQFMLTSWGYAPGTVDGFVGIQTKDAWDRWVQKSRDVEGKGVIATSIKPTIVTKPVPAPGPVTIIKNHWPNQGSASMNKFYGRPGTNLISMKAPYPLRIAWNTKQHASAMQINRKCAESANRVMTRALQHYGLPTLQKLGLDLYGGCYNNRLKKGGNTLSVHAWGAAIDFDPDHNQLRWGANRARMDDAAYRPFVNFWREEGWISLGIEFNYDWMHFQAAIP